MQSTLFRFSTCLAALAALALMSAAAHAKNEKITICHLPPGNPDNARTISIKENAWAAHQAHGDSQGPCPEPPPGDDDDGGSGGGNAGGGGNSGGSGNGGGSGSGGTSSGGEGFAVVLCGERSDGKGRRIEVSNVGRVMVQETECQ